MKCSTIRKLAALTLAGWIGASAAKPALDWQGPPFFLISKGSRLSEVLQSVGANYGMPVKVSAQINDSFSGKLQNMGPEQILDQLARQFALAWYSDGRTIFVHKASELTTEVITPAYVTADVVLQQAREAGMLDERYCRIRLLGTALEAYGLPPCLERLGQLNKRLDEQDKNKERSQESVRVFPLKYASASDGNYTYRTQQVVVPGVVSVLREMARERGNLDGKGAAGPVGLPIFSADPRANAVIVRDLSSQMTMYQDLIAQLDQKPEQIEISVAIIDVAASDLSALGVEWSGYARAGGVGLAVNAGQAGTSGISSVIGNTNNFMLRLNALEQSSKAKILSRPSVVTMNNMQAVLDRNITFYTKVASERTAQLEAVSTGSLLRVTPRLVKGSAEQEILLTLNIQDGRQSGAFSEREGLPQVQNSEITTQASLKLGQSLLLGGFVQDTQTETVSKIPLLGSLPLLGALFTNKTHQSQGMVRLFLIKAELANATISGPSS